MTVSPPVSPRVVAAILMIQNTSVTSGTLLTVASIALAFVIPPPLTLKKFRAQNRARRSFRARETGWQCKGDGVKFGEIQKILVEIQNA